MTERDTNYMWKVRRNLNLKFIEMLSTPWCGAVDQDWMSKLHALKHTCQLPDMALLSLPSRSGEGAPFKLL